MVTLHLEDRIAAALRDQAKARGLSLEAYLLAITQTQQPAIPIIADSGDVQEFDAALDELFMADTRPLPALPLTYSREDIYIDHD